jgi:FkbM family methyltransferase
MSDHIMIRLLKRIVKMILAKFGLVIFKRSTGIYVAEDETPALALRLCGTAEPFIVDGGAHKGAFVEAIREIAPQARFLCFEPDPALATALREKFGGDGQVQVVQAALGSDCGTATLNINRSRACNSLSSTDGRATGVLGDLMTTLDRVEVDVSSLDEAVRRVGATTCDIVKLDLQGHDLEALMGAGHVLSTANVVIVEVWFAPVYRDTATYLDICHLLRDRGFSIYSLAGLHYSTTDRLLWSDAVFLRADSPHLGQSVTI